MVPAAFGLLQCLFHDLIRQPFDLDIHLAGGDPVFRSGDFEIHVAEVVFIAKNIG